MQLCELLNQLTTAFGGPLCKQGGRIGGGAFISVHLYEWSFCTFEKKTKIKLFTGFCGIRVCVDELCNRTM